MMELWVKLVDANDPHFVWALREPQITTRFKQRLELNADATGLTGLWVAENVSMSFDSKTGKPSKTNRTDIVYFSDRAQPRLRLTFEFKKVTGAAANCKAYAQDGMRRFLTGMYAKDEPYGVMVAITADRTNTKIVEKLKQSLVKKDIANTLDYIAHATTGELLHAPSDELPGVAVFDSQHHRKTDKFDTFRF